MRNLLGRLNARGPEELGRIAAAWNVPVSGGDKLGQVAQLYRALTDPRTVRDMWDRLLEDERALVGVLALGDDEARPLAELAAELGRPEAEVRQTAVRLYAKGILAREGDADPLPVGTAPRLLLPRELALQFQRVRDEIDAGDTASTPMRTLLSLLDDRDVEAAAEAWGVRVIPGLRTREELTRSLLKQVGDRARLAALEGLLGKDAAAVWKRLGESLPGMATPLADVLADAGLGGNDARTAGRARKALEELEEALIVLHTYHADGTRWLFVPNEVRSPGAGAAAKPRDLPKPVEAPAGEVPYRHSHAVAWDLLTLLRALSPPLTHRIDDLADAPRSWLRHVNAGLWNRGSETPPAGYLDFLIELARVEGLVTGGDVAAEEPFQVNPIVRVWRDRSFGEQADRLRASWLASAGWIEGEGRDDVEVWGADWPGFRFKLLSSLTQLAVGTAYPLDAVAEWLAGRDPDMLGATFQVATARNTEVEADDAASRRAAVAEVVTVTLETGFAWFGLVETVRPPKGPRAIRVTEAAAAAARGEPLPAPAASDGPGLTVSAEGEIRLIVPTPLRVWSISAFADLEELGQVSRYRLTEASISRALRAGFELRHVERFLASQSGALLPEALAELLRGWSQGVQRVRIARVLRLMPDDPAWADDLAALLERSGYPVARAEGDLLVTIDDEAALSARETALRTKLRDAGFTPHGPPVPRPGSDRKRPEPRSRGR